MVQTSAIEPDDPELVTRSVAGDREAFSRIVTRYQTLVCSVAYSGIGEIGASEDVAQETFVTAWRQLAGLREPGKLRSWLCGIARNLVRDERRRLGREPAHAAAPLEAVDEVAAPGPLPSDVAITREREAILWSAIQRIPATYREPLVLYYREHKSVERVAAELELSENVVRQRLSRGRRRLHEQVAAFVEGALERTAPGAEFTAGVVGALPALSAASFASAAGGAAAKGGAAIGTKLAALAPAVVGPAFGVWATWSSYRSATRAARTEGERRAVQRQFATVLGSSVLFVAFVGAIGAGLTDRLDGARGVALGAAFLFAYAAVLVVLALRGKRAIARTRADEQRRHPEAFRAPAEGAFGPFFEYRSPARLLGLPLLHVRLSTPPDMAVRPAVGWIAVGDRAIGVLFAFGGLAVGAVSFGGLALGLACVGGIGVGVVAMGGLVAGWLAMGGVALGSVAAGGFAFGWTGADGGVVALAREFARGTHAVARHANDATAQAFFARHPWMNTDTPSGRTLVGLTCLPVLVPLLPRWLVRLAHGTTAR